MDIAKTEIGMVIEPNESLYAATFVVPHKPLAKNKTVIIHNYKQAKMHY